MVEVRSAVMAVMPWRIIVTFLLADLFCPKFVWTRLLWLNLTGYRNLVEKRCL